jgi:predicted Fe-S protein YdhL (DUF1289 family)
LCVGCLRTLDEIARWSALSNAERQAILDTLAGRAEHPKQASRDAGSATQTPGWTP